jgi:hypothetical protein
MSGVRRMRYDGDDGDDAVVGDVDAGDDAIVSVV